MRYLTLLGIGIFLTFLINGCADKSSDNIAPVISLLGDSVVYINLDSNYIEPGYTATDDVDGDITNEVKTNDNINIYQEGAYYIRYNVEDLAGNKAEEKSRKVKVLQF